MDWYKIVSEIKESGMTQAQIAAAIDISAGSLSELIGGKVLEPRWSKGDALRKLHAERCGTEKQAA